MSTPFGRTITTTVSVTTSKAETTEEAPSDGAFFFASRWWWTQFFASIHRFYFIFRRAERTGIIFLPLKVNILTMVICEFLQR